MKASPASLFLALCLVAALLTAPACGRPDHHQHVVTAVATAGARPAYAAPTPVVLGGDADSGVGVEGSAVTRRLLRTGARAHHGSSVSGDGDDSGEGNGAASRQRVSLCPSDDVACGVSGRRLIEFDADTPIFDTTSSVMATTSRPHRRSSHLRTDANGRGDGGNRV